MHVRDLDQDHKDAVEKMRREGEREQSHVLRHEGHAVVTKVPRDAIRVVDVSIDAFL